METFSVLLAICAGNSPVTGEFPAQRPVTRIFDFSFICVWITSWVNNREAGDLRRYRAHYDVIVMLGLFRGFLCHGWQQAIQGVTSTVQFMSIRSAYYQPQAICGELWHVYGLASSEHKYNYIAGQTSNSVQIICRYFCLVSISERFSSQRFTLGLVRHLCVNWLGHHCRVTTCSLFATNQCCPIIS